MLNGFRDLHSGWEVAALMGFGIHYQLAWG